MSTKTTMVADEALANKIQQGAELSAEIKILTEQLKGIKEDLSTMEPGKYLNGTGRVVTISETPKFCDIPPALAKKALREKRLGKNFMSCVKVGVTQLKRYLSDQEIGTLRSVDSYTRRYSFK